MDNRSLLWITKRLSSAPWEIWNDGELLDGGKMWGAGAYLIRLSGGSCCYRIGTILTPPSPPSGSILDIGGTPRLISLSPFSSYLYLRSLHICMHVVYLHTCVQDFLSISVFAVSCPFSPYVFFYLLWVHACTTYICIDLSPLFLSLPSFSLLLPSLSLPLPLLSLTLFSQSLVCLLSLSLVI